MLWYSRAAAGYLRRAVDAQGIQGERFWGRGDRWAFRDEVAVARRMAPIAGSGSQAGLQMQVLAGQVRNEGDFQLQEPLNLAHTGCNL